MGTLRTCLKVGHVGIGHAAGGAERQIKIEAQLSTAAGDETLLWRPAAHGASAKI